MTRFQKLNLGLYLAAVITLFSAAAVFRSGAVDIHLHDTYFVVSYYYLFAGLAIILSMLALLYVITSRITKSPVLTFLHTIGSIALLACILWQLLPLSATPDSIAARRFLDMSSAANLTRTIIRIFLWWQLLLPINWLVSLRARP